MNHKALIFDLDGTAMQSVPSAVPSQRFIDAIKNASTFMIFSCATGRNWPFARKAIQSIPLSFPCIISAGTQIINPITEKIIWQKNIETEDSESVLEIVKHHPYRVDLNDEMPDPKGEHDIVMTKESLYLINIKAVAESKADIIEKEINKIKGVACIKAMSQTYGFFDLHVTHRDATKENAIHKLCGLLGFKPEDVIGVGDGYNDIHLFNAVGYKIAMGNAVSDLKAQADLVIDSIDNDGLAKFIESMSDRLKTVDNKGGV